jgi:8-oxo-dGTP diphosphatase
VADKITWEEIKDDRTIEQKSTDFAAVGQKLSEAIERAKSTPEKPMYAVGASVLVTNKEGKLLLARRKNNSGAGLLSTPGGRIEYDESVTQAGAREFHEECGADIGLLSIIGWRKHNRFGNHYFMFYLHASTVYGDIKNCIPDKSEDWAWFDVADLNEKNCTEPRDIINILIDRGFARPRPCQHKNVDKPGSVFGETCTDCGKFLNNGF